MPRSPSRALAALAAAALAATACAGLRAREARTEKLRAELDALHYQKPMIEVWDAVRHLLADQGYPLAGPDAAAVGQKPMDTMARIFTAAQPTHAYREDDGLLQQLGAFRGDPSTARTGLTLETGWFRTRVRYRADAFDEPGGIRVVFTRIDEDPTSHRERPTRDLDEELSLARRLDPEAAARIEAAVEKP
jgi:hypothetical protein